jgi:AcrR family transcriptional regulator
VTRTTTTARRPRNRREQIIAAAARQFRASGYHNVGITDIAEAVGITSAALYRHFDNKQDLLQATLQDAMDRLPQALGVDGSSLDDLLAQAGRLPVHGQGVGLLWARELTHLPADVQRVLRRQVVSAVEPLRRGIGSARPQLPDDTVDLLLWATVGVIASDGFRATRIDAETFQRLLLEACQRLTRLALPLTPGPGVSSPTSRQQAVLPSTRHEAILAAAARQFGDRGYQAVGVDDIGADAGITGATVYHHFENKAAILSAALNRCVQAMLFDLSGALESSSSPGEALDKALGCFVRVCVDHGRAVAALQHEAVNLSGEQRRAVFDAEGDYVVEWSSLLAAHRPELSIPEAQVLVHAAISSLVSLIAIRRVRARANLSDELRQIGRAVLGLGPDLPSTCQLPAIIGESFCSWITSSGDVPHPA